MEDLEFSPNQLKDKDNSHTYYLVFAGVGFLFVLIVAYMLYSLNKSPGLSNVPTSVTGGPQITTEPTLAVYPKKGVVLFKASATEVKSGQTIRVTVNANSEGMPITGFDLLLSYDNNVVEYKSARSLVRGITLSPFNNGSYVTLTGFADNPSGQPPVFNTNDIIELTFVAKTTGNPNFAAQPVLKNAERGITERSRIIDSNNNNYEPLLDVLR